MVSNVSFTLCPLSEVWSVKPAEADLGLDSVEVDIWMLKCAINYLRDLIHIDHFIIRIITSLVKIALSTLSLACVESVIVGVCRADLDSDISSEDVVECTTDPGGSLRFICDIAGYASYPFIVS